MSGPKTTWDDLARFGHGKGDVTKRANTARNGTLGEAHLNDSFVDHYGWNCYNAIKGSAYEVGSRPTSVTKSTTRHVWDNSANGNPQTESWTESVTEESSASLFTSSSASMTLSSSITVYGVASSSFSFTIGTETNTSKSDSRSKTVTRVFDIEVGPYETLQLVRTETTLGQISAYQVPYGLSPGSVLGTDGNLWNNHYHWGFDINGLLGNPTGYIALEGVSQEIDYTFKMIRTGGKGAITSKASVTLGSGTDRSISVPLEIEDGIESDKVSDTKIVAERSVDCVPGF